MLDGSEAPLPASVVSELLKLLLRCVVDFIRFDVHSCGATLEAFRTKQETVLSSKLASEHL